PASSVAAMVDDSLAFRRLLKGPYLDFASVEKDLKEFQIKTATSFVRRNVQSAKAYERETGQVLPDGCPYRYILFVCVHGRRSNVTGKRYRCYDCPARFSVTYKGECYEIGNAYLWHSHSFQVGKPWLYACNRRLSEEQERLVLNLMRTFRRTQEMRAFVRQQYDIRLTRRDLYVMRRRHRKACVTEVEEVTQMLQRNGEVKVLHAGNQIRYLFFVPSRMLELVGQYGEVILADSTYQINYGGYILWHCMFVDVSGLGMSFFYALLPNETEVAYEEAVRGMLELAPSVAGARTLVMDKCAAQVNAFRNAYPNANIVFCRVHIMRDMRRRCSHLPLCNPEDKRALFSMLRSLLYTYDCAHYHRIMEAISLRSAECFQYLRRTWIPWRLSWAAHLMDHVVLFGCDSTNRIENENKHLKETLSERSTLLHLFQVIVQRASSMIEERETLLGRDQLGECHVQHGASVGDAILRRLSSYARRQYARHSVRVRIRSVNEGVGCWLVEDERIGMQRVVIGNGCACGCRFNRQWRIPCAHIIHVASLHAYQEEDVLRGCRWVLPSISTCAPMLSEDTEGTLTVAPVRCPSDVVLDRAAKIRITRDMFASLETQILSMGTEEFQRTMGVFACVRELLTSHNDVQLYARSSQLQQLQLLSSENLPTFQGMEPSSSAAATHVTAGNGTRDGMNSPEREVSEGVTLVSPVAGVSQSPCAERRRRRRKSPLLTRAVEVVEGSMTSRELTFMTLKRRTSARHRTYTWGTKRGTAEKEADSAVCYLCGEEEDACGSSEIVEWISCDVCLRWFHQTCASYHGEAAYTCARCCGDTQK
ncbi:unnamed protein product, partial [Dicrocoelium dendriticum]